VALPREIKERKRAPHRLTVWRRSAEFPDPGELLKFLGGSGGRSQGEEWMRLAPEGTVESVLVFRPEDEERTAPGFEHPLVVESASSRLCFLAAYFMARRQAGVVWVQKRARAYAPAAFAELFLGDADVEASWDRAVK